MAEIVSMPKMSDTMTEGVIAVWHKKVGDKVSSGELMAEIETDKATMEYESYHDGTVLYLGADAGSAVAVNGILAIVGNPGEDFSSLLGGAAKATTPAPAVQEVAPVEASAPKIDVSGIKAELVLMPKMSDTMTEGVIAAWHKKIGETVKEGELLAEIQTDKATMEYESYNAGTLLYIGAEADGSVKVNDVLAIVGDANADWKTLLASAKQGGSSVAAPAASTAVEAPKATTPVETPSAPVQQTKTETKAAHNGPVKASPLAKKLASDKGVNISEVVGSGPHGRVVKSDVINFVPAAKTASTSSSSVSTLGQESFEDIPMNSMRKAIARNLTSSQFGAPHFYLTMDIDMDNAIKARTSINEFAAAKISFNDIVVKAVATALRQHPLVNSTVLNDVVRLNQHIHVGVAVAIPDGLVVPVLKHTDLLSLSQISAGVKDLAGKAKDKKLGLDQMTGATFTISNLGMFGIEQFTSIINAPASCIMAIGGIKQVPVVKNGQIVPGNIMKVTLTCDHRSVDGAIGAAFLQTFKGLMEDPVRILV